MACRVLAGEGGRYRASISKYPDATAVTGLYFVSHHRNGL
jgi:hypothetical protein